MDWSSNLIQILLFIQFMPLKDTFSNPSLKARIWMPSLPASVMWMGPNWEAPVLSVPATALWQVWTPGDRLGPRYGTSVVRHTCPHCHLSWEQPFKSVHFYILPPGPILRSDPNNCRIYYTKLDENWKAAKHSACSTTCSALLMTFHNTHLRPDDQLTFQPTNK